MKNYDTGWKPTEAHLISLQGMKEALPFAAGLALIGIFMYAGFVFIAL